MALNAYPLCWPEGWKRTASYRRTNGRFTTQGRIPSVSDGCGRIIGELEKLKVTRDDLVISTNLPLRLDGMPRSDQAAPLDPGAAVYWRKSPSSPMKCMAIDRYTAVADNLCAIAATLEAMRAIERHGGAEILERAFTGFAALPASTGRDWRDVLGVAGTNITREFIEGQFRSLARVRHPDVSGGSHEAMAELNKAREDALREVTA